MIVLLSYAIFCLFLARHDSRVIKSEKSIHHDRNAMYHAICWAVGLFVTLFTHSWYLLACMPFTGRAVFDVALNLQRKLPWDYVSPWLLSASPAIRRKVSVLDRIEYRVFKSGRWPKVIYIAVIAVLIYIHCIYKFS